MRLKGLLLIALTFFSPISIFITDILVFSIVAIWLIEGQFKDKWQHIKSSSWILSLLALLFLYTLGLLWGNNHQGAQWVFEKSALLLLLPVLYTSNFSHKEIRLSVYSFISSCTLSALIALFINLGWIKHLFKYSDIFSKNWSISAFMVYTEHNVYLAFVLLIVVFLIYNNVKKTNLVISLSLVFLINGISVFSENGRSGQLAVIMMVFLFSFLVLRHKRIWFLLAIFSFCISLVLAYNYSPTFKSRVITSINQSKQLDMESSNSINTRYYLTTYSIDKILEQPIIGHGTGSFVEEYSSINKHATRILDDVHKTPHNNYLFVCFELGLIGLIIFLSLFYFQIKEYRDLTHGKIRIIMPLMFLLIMITDTYIQNHNTAVLYTFVSFIFSTYSFK